MQHPLLFAGVICGLVMEVFYITKLFIPILNQVVKDGKVNPFINVILIGTFFLELIYSITAFAFLFANNRGLIIVGTLLLALGLLKTILPVKVKAIIVRYDNAACLGMLVYALTLIV